MAIPESQLDRWSAQGSVTQSKNTYATVKNALESSQAPYEGRSYEVFLQGSYGNHTNIYAESDVDVVIRLTEIIRSDLSLLPPDQQAAYHQAYRTATYTFNAFKEGVHTRIKTAFGRNSVTTGDKAFHIEPTSSRRSSDVVTCQEYRRYIRFNTITDQEYIPGILIPNTSTGDVINYPKVHSENLTAKNQATHGWLKPTIRIFKNMRNRLIEERRLPKILRVLTTLRECSTTFRIPISEEHGQIRFATASTGCATLIDQDCCVRAASTGFLRTRMCNGLSPNATGSLTPWLTCGIIGNTGMSNFEFFASGRGGLCNRE
jgi:hypothetical protein